MKEWCRHCQSLFMLNMKQLSLFSAYRNELPDYQGSEKDRVRVIVR